MGGMVLQVTPEVLYCAKKAGVTHVLKAGGAQAIAAMAWGTESCPKVTLFRNATYIMTHAWDSHEEHQTCYHNRDSE